MKITSRKTHAFFEIKVDEIDKDRISILGKEYYAKDYLEEMMRREYQRGKKEGQQVHIAQIEKCSNCH